MGDGDVMHLKRVILAKLKDRNTREKRFTGIVNLCNSLHESVDFLVKENRRLSILKTKRESVCAEPRVSEVDLAVSVLQKKIYELQQELTELHKNKGEYTEQVIEFRKTIDEKEKEISQIKRQVETMQSSFESSINLQEQLNDQANEAKHNLQLVKDEFSALCITYTSLQRHAVTLEEEHKDLLARWMVYQVREADELNKENELLHRLKQIKIQKEMEEAIREPVTLNSGS